MWTKHRNRVQRTRFLCIETEFVELGFHTHKLSSLNSFSIHRNRVSLNSIFMSHPCPIHLTVMWVLSWKSSLLDSISVNGPQHSTCCCGSQLGTCFLFVRLTISQILSTLLPVHFSSSQYTQSSLSVHSMLFTTLISHNISGIQYCIY